jgi:hypothetical protein
LFYSALGLLARGTLFVVAVAVMNLEEKKEVSPCKDLKPA